jgi:hypothetical protein
MTEDIKTQADRAREAESVAVRQLADLDAFAASADAAFKKDPTAETHAAQAVAAQKATNARAVFEVLKASNAELYAAEAREAMLFELESKRPRGEVDAATAAFDALIAGFVRDLPIAFSSLVGAIALHNAAAARCNELARSLRLSEAFPPRQLAHIVGMTGTGHARPELSLGGYPEAPTSINFTLHLPLGGAR